MALMAGVSVTSRSAASQRGCAIRDPAGNLVRLEQLATGDGADGQD